MRATVLLLASCLLLGCPGGSLPDASPPDAGPFSGDDAGALDGGGDAGAPDGGDDAGATDGGGDGGASARVHLVVRAVEHCAVESPVFPGLAQATPTGARVGLVSVELLRTRQDLAPATLAARGEVELLDGGTVADGEVPAGTYRYLRYSLSWASVSVPALAHQGGLSVGGTLELDVTTAAHTRNGQPRTPGLLVARFSAPGGNTWSTQSTVALDCPLSAAGGLVETGAGVHRVTVPVPGGPVRLDPGDDRSLEGRFPLAGAVTWRDLAGAGFQPGVLDLQAVGGSELAARLPACELLLSDRCEAGARPPRVVAAWPMPDSATSTCTDGRVVVACPDAGSPGFGQDANTSVNAPRLVVDGDTVRDEVTGLRWQKEEGPAADWWDAQASCDALVLGGSDDWSLPSRIELASLLDVGRFAPSIDVSAFPGASTDFFWTASPASFSSLAFGIRFDQGFVYDHDPRVSGRVRCVTGGRSVPSTHLVVADADTVRDVNTGLVWQRRHFPPAPWLDALATCEALTLSGHDDWRLPTVKELLTIVDDTAINPSGDVAAFPDLPAEWFWSSSPSLAPTDYAWTVSFTDGFDTPAAVAQRYVFRCVR